MCDRRELVEQGRAHGREGRHVRVGLQELGGAIRQAKEQEETQQFHEFLRGGRLPFAGVERVAIILQVQQIAPTRLAGHSLRQVRVAKAGGKAARL